MRPKFKPVDDDDDAFDENGILKDGRTCRTPLYLMDSLQRAIADHGAKHWPRSDKPLVTDAFGGTAGLNRPGFRIATNDAAARTARDAAYADYDQQLTDAWRSPAHDAIGAPDNPRRSKDTMTVDEREAAYEIYDQELSNAWRGAER